MRTLLLVLLATLPALAGCASDDAAAPPPTATTVATPTAQAAAPVVLDVSTSGAYPVNPGFSPAALEAPVGANVTVKLRNAETAPIVNHDWVLEGVDGAAVKAVAPGQGGEVSFTAPAPGEYKYFCSIGDHRQRGMEGTLTVK
jgi:plastocyanin